MSARVAILISTAAGWLVGGLVMLFVWPHWVAAFTGDEFDAMAVGARILIGGPIMLVVAWAIGAYASEKFGGDQPARWRHIATGAAIGFGPLIVLALILTIDVLNTPPVP